MDPFWRRHLACFGCAAVVPEPTGGRERVVLSGTRADNGCNLAPLHSTHRRPKPAGAALRMQCQNRLSVCHFDLIDHVFPTLS